MILGCWQPCPSLVEETDGKAELRDRVLVYRSSQSGSSETHLTPWPWKPINSPLQFNFYNLQLKDTIYDTTSTMILENYDHNDLYLSGFLYLLPVQITLHHICVCVLSSFVALTYTFYTPFESPSTVPRKG